MCIEGPKKKEPKEWRELVGKHCKKVYNTKYRLVRPDIRYQQNSMFKVTTNIGTGTVDYWLWIMDHKLRANLDNK